MTGDISRGAYEASETFGRVRTLTRSILVCLDSTDLLYLASETEVLILTPGSASWLTLRVDASRRRRGFLREMIGPTPRMLGGGRTIAGAVARCKPIHPGPYRGSEHVPAPVSVRTTVHSDGSPEVQNGRERTRRGSDELK